MARWLGQDVFGQVWKRDRSTHGLSQCIQRTSRSTGLPPQRYNTRTVQQSPTSHTFVLAAVTGQYKRLVKRLVSALSALTVADQITGMGLTK